MSIQRIILLTVLLLAFTASPALAQSATPEPVVHALMFWQAGCQHCEETIYLTLEPIHEKYGAQFDLRMVELVTMQDADSLYAMAAAYGVPKENAGVPFLVLGETALIGADQIRWKLSGLIDDYLTRGGVALPDKALRALLPKPTSASPSNEPPPALVEASRESGMRDNGFALATTIMVFMAAALIYSIVAFALGKTFALPAWADWLIPVIIVMGIGVAGYLTYVETQSVSAVCGPVGDCNSVQSSSYAILFGILPVGLLGILGDLGLLAAWLARKFIPKLEKPAAGGFLGMSFFAVIFSMYLTYLELFVIKAICIWCLTSAVLVTLLLLLGLPPAARLLSSVDDDDEIE